MSLALLTLLALLPPPAPEATDARPTVLHVGLRVVADCRPGAPPDNACPAQQRSQDQAGVPPQVQALSPAQPGAGSAATTVTY